MMHCIEQQYEGWPSNFKQLTEQDVYFKQFPDLIGACTNKVLVKASQYLSLILTSPVELNKGALLAHFINQ